MPLCLHTQLCCQLSCLGALLTHHVLPGQLPISSLLKVHGCEQVGCETPFPSSPSPLSPMHSGWTKPGAVCPGQDASQQILCLARMLCAMVCPLAPLSYGDFCSAGQGRGADASPGTLAGTSHFHLHNGDCSTTTINPLWDIFRPGCANEGEMTGSLHIQTV